MLRSWPQTYMCSSVEQLAQTWVSLVRGLDTVPPDTSTPGFFLSALLFCLPFVKTYTF